MTDTPIKTIRPAPVNVNQRRRAVEEPQDVAAPQDVVSLPDPRAPLKPHHTTATPRLAPGEEIDSPAPAPLPIADARAEPPPEKPAPTNGSKLPPITDRTLAAILPYLVKPFKLEHIELKPGATTQDKSRALALAYVDTRIYQGRLDALAGVAGWAAEFVPWGETRLICRLTILGVTKQATGEGDKADPNCGTIAEAQAFKRACSAFGLGRYLYDLPQLWCAYDRDKKRFADPAGDIRRIYQQGGLL